jgi:thiamine phosphate synthase YjbQ (UPF0047 family)
LNDAGARQIVVIENISRRRTALGEGPQDAAYRGTSEIGLAVLATTLSIVAVFVPVAVTGGRLDFGPWEQIFYGEFDGGRRKRVLVKIIGQ